MIDDAKVYESQKMRLHHYLYSEQVKPILNSKSKSDGINFYQIGSKEGKNECNSSQVENKPNLDNKKNNSKIKEEAIRQKTSNQAKAQSVMAMLEARKNNIPISNPQIKKPQQISSNEFNHTQSITKTQKYKQNDSKNGNEILLQNKSKSDSPMNLKQNSTKNTNLLSSNTPMTKINYNKENGKINNSNVLKQKNELKNKEPTWNEYMRPPLNSKKGEMIKPFTPKIYYESIENRLKRRALDSNTPKAYSINPIRNLSASKNQISGTPIKENLNSKSVHHYTPCGQQDWPDVILRNEMWLQRKNAKLSKLMGVKESMKLSGCTFKPSLETKIHTNISRSEFCEKTEQQKITGSDLNEVMYSNSYSAINKVKSRSKGRDKQINCPSKCSHC